MSTNGQKSPQLEKVQSKIITISRKFHYEPLNGSIKDIQFPKNTTLMAISYLLDGNHLIMGDPGWGKTTSAKIIASVFTGVPYDVYDMVELRGNPQKYEEKTIARPSYGDLVKGLEKVVWLGGIGVPVLIGDEVNRFSYETQDVLLQGVDTGVWTYLNSAYNSGKRPSFFTANYRDDGNGHLIPPLLDRMLLVTEEGYTGTTGDYSKAKKAREDMLCNDKVAKKALTILNESGLEEFNAFISKNLLASVAPIINDEKAEIRSQIDKVRMTYKDEDINKAVNDPLLFLGSMFAEINYSNQYGAKRSTDPKSDETHDMTHLGVHVQKTISPRTQMAAIQYAKAFAWITGSNEATLDHIKFVLPHILGHKLDYHDDFINDHGHDTRKDMLELHLAGKLVETAFTNYQNIAVEVKNLIHKIQNGKAQEIANSNLDDYDHPYLKELILEVRESLKTPFGRDANQEKSRQGKEATI